MERSDIRDRRPRISLRAMRATCETFPWPPSTSSTTIAGTTSFRPPICSFTPAGGARPSWGRAPRCSRSIFMTSSIAAARRAGVPVFYCTQDIRPNNRPPGAVSTRRQRSVPPDGYAIYKEFPPEPSDVVILKQRASAFQGTPLFSHLSLLGVQSLIVCGESTSGCVRASAVDAYSNGFHVAIVEECTFDRSELIHKVNLFDLHHKYVDVMHLDEVEAHLDRLAAKPSTQQAAE